MEKSLVLLLCVFFWVCGLLGGIVVTIDFWPDAPVAAEVKTKTDHVKTKDLIHADEVVCKDHKGTSSIALYTDGLSIYCNDFYRVSAYSWE